MKLIVSDREFVSGIDMYVISLSDFADKARHPFIATTRWDVAYVDLNENTPRGIIKQVIQNCKVIPVFDNADINTKVMQLLCEVVPDSAAELRSSFMKDREGFNALVKSLSETYGWRDHN